MDMIHKHEFGAEAIAYLTVRLAEFGSFGRLLAQHFTDNLSSFCYLPDSFEEKEKPVCFLQDLVVSTTEERRMMERRDAEFLHSFLAAKPNRGLLVQSSISPGKPRIEAAGFEVFRPGIEDCAEENPHRDQSRDALFVRSRAPTLESVRALLDVIPPPRFLGCLMNNADEIQREASRCSPDLLALLVRSCEGIVASAFDHYVNLFFLPAQTGDDLQIAPHELRRMGSGDVSCVSFSRFVAEHVRQKLCISKWSRWLAGFYRFPGSELWSLVPSSMRNLRVEDMALPVAASFPDTDRDLVSRARLKVFSFIAKFLEDEKNLVLFGPVLHDPWPEAISIETSEWEWYGKIKHAISNYNVLRHETASLEAVSNLWKYGIGVPPSCLLIRDCADLGLGKAAFEVSYKDLQEKLIPGAQHLIVGIFRGDLCLAWSKEGPGNSLESLLGEDRDHAA